MITRAELQRLRHNLQWLTDLTQACGEIRVGVTLDEARDVCVALAMLADLLAQGEEEERAAKEKNAVATTEMEDALRALNDARDALAVANAKLERALEGM